MVSRFSAVEAVQILSRVLVLEVVTKCSLAAAEEALVMIVIALEQVGQSVVKLGKRALLRNGEH